MNSTFINLAVSELNTASEKINDVIGKCLYPHEVSLLEDTLVALSTARTELLGKTPPAQSTAKVLPFKISKSGRVK